MMPDHPNSPKVPVLGGIYGVKFSGRIYLKPTRINMITIDTFKITIILFTQEDSCVPRININDMSTTIKTAGKLIMPCSTEPSARVTLSKGVIKNSRGRPTPHDSNSFSRYPDQLDATV